MEIKCAGSFSKGQIKFGTYLVAGQPPVPTKDVPVSGQGDQLNSKQFLLLEVKKGVKFGIKHPRNTALIFVSSFPNCPKYEGNDVYVYYMNHQEENAWGAKFNESPYEVFGDGGDIIITDPPPGHPL